MTGQLGGWSDGWLANMLPDGWHAGRIPNWLVEGRMTGKLIGWLDKLVSFLAGWVTGQLVG